LGMAEKFKNEEIDLLFNALDRDGSGKISLDEVEDFVQMKRKGEASK
jgi:Ca2+-binding EF-hand superfamily protein